MYYITLGANNKGADQAARMRRLNCAFVVSIGQKQVTHFLYLFLIYSLLKSRPGVQHHITHTAIKYTKPLYTEL